MDNNVNLPQSTSLSEEISTNDLNVFTLVKRIKKNKFIKIISSFIFFLFIIIISVLLISIVGSKLSNDVPNIAGYQMYIVLGGSMNPTFDVGSLAIIDRVAENQIIVDDIITFRNYSGNGITTHRVVDIVSSNNQLSFITRGDANDVDDINPVPADNVIGKVVFTIPYLGRFLNFAQSRAGLLVLIIIPGLFIIFMEVLSIFKTIKSFKKIDIDEKIKNQGGMVKQ